MATERPTWYETDSGMIVCQWCRQKLIGEWAPGTYRPGSTFARDFEGHLAARNAMLPISADEVVTAADFTNLGKTPWKGAEVGDRYMQCDECLRQWGPNA